MSRNRIVFNSSLLQAHRNNRCIAVSGGVDSIAIAHFLQQANPDLTLFHFNHKLRPQNDEMEDAVRRFAKKFGLDLIVKTADEFPLNGNNTSEESAAREARLAAMGSLGFDEIVVCHHMDDCIESYVMNCMNGVLDKKDYYCIPPRTQMNNFTVVRPFLMTRKDVLASYVGRHGLCEFVVNDETNDMNGYRRNKVRNVILPLLKEEWVGLETVVYKYVVKDYERKR